MTAVIWIYAAIAIVAAAIMIKRMRIVVDTAPEGLKAVAVIVSAMCTLILAAAWPLSLVAIAIIHMRIRKAQAEELKK